MLLTLENEDVMLLVRKAIEDGNIPVPKGYHVESIKVSTNEDTGGAQIDIEIFPQEALADGLLKAN